MLASAVIDELQFLFSEENHRIGIAYVYCSSQHKDGQTAGDLLASILKQLAAGQGALSEWVKRAYRDHEREGRRLRRYELVQLLENVVSSYEKVFVVVVDGLDECSDKDGSRGKFLEGIFDLQDGHEVRLFLTSRCVPEISGMFDQAVSVDVDGNDDFTVYMQYRMGRLPGVVQEMHGLMDEIWVKVSDAADGV